MRNVSQDLSVERRFFVQKSLEQKTEVVGESGRVYENIKISDGELGITDQLVVSKDKPPTLPVYEGE